jgi:hypothetical protein
VKATGIIIVAGAAGALALIGLALLPSSTPSESSARPSKPEARAPSSASTPPSATPGDSPGTHTRPGEPPPTSEPLAATKESAPRGEAPLPSPQGSPPPADAQDPRSASAPAREGANAAVVDRLDISRKARTEEERIRALEWLANNAELEHFDAIQDIQINDPSPEVRKAAEAAVSAVLRRHRDSHFPQERVEKDPQGYMRDVRVKNP